MKYATLYVDDFYLNNRIFDLNDPISNRDDCLYHFWLLKEKLKERGIELNTQDLSPPEVEFTIYNDIPNWILEGRELKGVNYLIIWESEVVKPLNWIPYFHRKYFKRVFSWYDLWDDPFYVKYYWPVKKKPMLETPKTEFLCIINSRKSSPHYKELYTERQRAIDYFGDKIHVYGQGYKPIPNKSEVLSKYKFAICYENAKDIPGYVTEKIWDCYQAGTIPVYWGDWSLAGDWSAYIPHIVRDYRGLEAYLNSMSDDLYRQYQEGMRSQLNDSLYDSQVWVETILSNLQ